MNPFKKIIQKVLSEADIQIDGNRPWDIRIHREEAYRRFLTQGSLGVGESYMEGWWDTDSLDQLVTKLHQSRIMERFDPTWTSWVLSLGAKLINSGKKSLAYEIGKKHYDLGNELFQYMLDRRMVYSCGYWKTASNLEEAQIAKLNRICRKLLLKPGMKVLDIGCGWGSFAKYASEKHGVKVVGISVSKEQVKWAQKNCRGLPVKIRLQDYRDLTGRFDRIVSVGMFEHVGLKNYVVFMKKARRCLKDSGLFLLQTIGANFSSTWGDPWIQKYIFPRGMIPSLKQITAAIENLFSLEDLENFGSDYDKTLMAWFENFDKHWGEIRTSYDEKFYRMWKYFLLSCAGIFRARFNHVWQIVLSPQGVSGGYRRLV